MIEVMKLQFKNKQHTLVSFILILLTVMVFGVVIQLISWNLKHLDSNTIRIPMLYFGSWLGALGGIIVLTRGSNGEGKFLSRLPMSKYEVFLGKILYLISIYLVITAVLVLSAWIILGLVKLLYPSLHFSGIPTLHVISGDVLRFIKYAPPFLFLTALGLWLQKWFSSNTARNMLILAILTIFIFIPVVIALFSVNHAFMISDSTILAFFNHFHKPFLVVLEVVLFFGAMGLYRIRHFRNF